MISSLCNKRRITLLELLTTLSTVVILLTLALPSLAQLQTEQRNAAAFKMLRRSFGIVRSQAITVDPLHHSADPRRADTAAPTGGDSKFSLHPPLQKCGQV